jgi:hypothetical protein
MPCVYRKLKLGHNGDAVRQGSRGNGYFQLVELGARMARPYLASDAFAIHYNRWHMRLESDAGALRQYDEMVETSKLLSKDEARRNRARSSASSTAQALAADAPHAFVGDAGP